MKKKCLLSTILAAVVFSFFGCASPEGVTVSEKRQYILDMKEKTLNELYRKRPEAKEKIAMSAGYAVFSNVDVMVIFVSGGNGYGVAVDDDTGENVYMKMGSGGLGFGVGVKDFREVIIFKKQYAFDKFVEEGWEFGGTAEAAAKAEEKGGSAEATGNIGKNVEVYQFTESGISLQAKLTGTKYYKFNELN